MTVKATSKWTCPDEVDGAAMETEDVFECMQAAMPAAVDAKSMSTLTSVLCDIDTTLHPSSQGLGSRGSLDDISSTMVKRIADPIPKGRPKSLAKEHLDGVKFLADGAHRRAYSRHYMRERQQSRKHETMWTSTWMSVCCQLPKVTTRCRTPIHGPCVREPARARKKHESTCVVCQR